MNNDKEIIEKNDADYEIDPVQEKYNEVLKNLRPVVNSLSIAIKNYAEAVVKELKQYFDELNLLTSDYAQSHRRVVYLAYCHRKARVRKKNLNRLRRMK